MTSEPHKPLVTLTMLFKNIFVYLVCSTVAVFYMKITYYHHIYVG